jgi:flagellar motility protein MotE (MotC chaperone)
MKSPGRSAKKVVSRYLPVAVLCLVLFLAAAMNTARSEQQDPPAKQPVQPVRKSLEEERLNILRSDIEKEIETFRKLKREADDSQKVIDEKGREKLLKLVKMFEAMPAEDAAKKLEKLDEDTLVMILVTLKPKTAGKILAQMDSERVASLSKKILSRGKTLPEKSSP